MKFEHNGMKFEVSHLDHVVINTVRQIIKPAVVTRNGITPARVTSQKERVEDKGSRIWVRFDFKHEIRWGKYSLAPNEVMNDDALVDPKLAKLYQSHDETQKMIMVAMRRPDIHVWFSGTYCNIEICDNWQEVQKIKAQEEARKRRARQIQSRTPNIEKILHDALMSCGAAVGRELVSTPFGPIPVMTISGSGRRDDLINEVEWIEKTGTFVSLDEAARQFKIPRR